MRSVEGFTLWLGNARDARDPKTLFDAEIQAVVDLAGNEPPAAPPRGLVYLRFPLVDGAGNPVWMLRMAIRAVAGLLGAKAPTLVCCSAGMSRGPVVAAAAASELRHRPLSETLEWTTRGGAADVSPAFLKEVESILIVPAQDDDSSVFNVPNVR